MIIGVSSTDTASAPGRKILEKHNKMKAAKANWLPMYQRVAKYVFSRKADFTNTVAPGEFLNADVYDNTAANANHLMASTLIGSLWPNGAKTFQITKPSKIKVESQKIKEFFDRITKVMVEAIDHPKAGFLTALEEYMLDQGAFGISGIYVEETKDPEMPVRFTAVDAKKICVEEGVDGFIDTVYIEREYTLRQVVQMFGEKALSPKLKEQIKRNDYDCKVKLVHAIEPRSFVDMRKKGNLNSPVASKWVEVETAHVLEESGYNEMPVFVTRFWKAMDEVYGRSPATESLADIREINALRQAAIIATEKLLDPPLIIKSDGSLGAGDIDTSAGGITVQYVNGRIGDAGKTVEQLVTVGELTSTFKRIDELREIIFNAFFIDRLLDLNNEQRMTYGEAQIRNELRGQSLGSTYARQISELFTRIIERVFNILLSKGLMGVVEGGEDHTMLTLQGIEVETIPVEIAKLMVDGNEVYKVNFISPAARVMRAEELAGILRTVEFATNTAAIGVPDILDNINFDVVVRKVADLSGASSEIMRSQEEVEAIRNARAEAQQATIEAQQEMMQSQMAKDQASAVASIGSLNQKKAA
jgi:hypothetical protein